MEILNREKLNGKQTAACVIIALLSEYAISNMLKTKPEYYTFGNSVFALLLLPALVWLFGRVVLIKDIRLKTVSAVLGSAFSLFTVVGANMLNYGSVGVGKTAELLSFIFGIPLFSAVIAVILNFLCNREPTAAKNNGLRKKLGEFSEKKVFFVCLILIFAAWMPGLIASYPGIYAYDCVYQMGFYNSGVINLHHPLIHTYLLGFFVENVGTWLKSREIGLFLYSLLQMLILSSVFSCCVCFIKRRGLSVNFQLAALALFMFLPTNAIMSFSATKDVLYAAFFAMFTLVIFDVCREPELLKSKKFFLKTVLFAFLQIIFRNQGVYVFLFAVVVGFIFLAGYRKRVLALFLCTAVVFGIYSGPVTKLLHGEKERTVKEMMSVPAVQLSRAYCYNGDALTAEETRMIESYIPNCKAYTVTEGISDLVKNTFNSELFKENPMKFIKLWIKVGLKLPLAYVDAFAKISIGYWYPDMNYRDKTAWHPYWEYKSTEQNSENTWVTVERTPPKFMKPLTDFYDKLTYGNGYQKIPVVSMLFSSGFTVWIMLFMLAWCIYSKKYKYLFAIGIPFSLWLTLLLGPVVLYRYIYPMAVTVPLMLAVMLSESLPKKTEEKQNG